MDTEFQNRLLETFRIEAREHTEALSAGLIALEKAADDGLRLEIVETVFREAHSMKGAARAVNMTRVESLSHALEGVFARLRRESEPPTPALFDLLHRAVDGISALLFPGDTPGSDPDDSLTRGLIRELERAAEGVPVPPSPPPSPPRETPRHPPQWETPPPARPATWDSVRISSGKLVSLLNQAEEMLSVKQAALHRAAELEEMGATLVSWEKEWKKARPALRGLRKARRGAPERPLSDAEAGQLDRLIELCEAGHAMAKSLHQRNLRMAKTEAGLRHAFDGMVDGLICELKGALMLPCSVILDLLPKVVRDLARDRGKEAGLVVTGEGVEIDKRVLEELKEPLIHLVRNCVDHGIESPAERRRRNKPAVGVVSLSASLIDSTRVEMVVGDDGGGIDTGRLTETVVRQGMVERDEAERLTDGQLLEMIFRSGVSTSPLITDISGRGLGLAIVREKVEKLGGTVTVESRPHHGTTFRMVLPLTISTYRGVLVRVGDGTFIIPGAAVERVTRIDRSFLQTVENRETVELDGEAVSFVHLADILRMRRRDDGNSACPLLPIFVMGAGAGRIAFGVDDVLGEQEILVKGLGPQLERVRNVAGATVLGTGAVAIILHPGDLVKSAIREDAPAAAAPQADEVEAKQGSVLIVEDSITSRTLLKNILETAGYRVRTAVDGIDALTQLRLERADLVVSDVDMPRMNGFDLTAKLRSSREFGDLPVVLVTSLDSREDRERGIEVGADAYIVKSSFDQSNLLAVIRRLV